MKMCQAAICFAWALSPTLVYAAPPRDTTQQVPIIDNQRVRVWDVTWAKGQLMQIRKIDLDAVQLFLADGEIGIRNADGSTKAVKRKKGDAVFLSKGAEIGGDASNEPPTDSVIIELKDQPGAPIENRTGLPNAFPRPRAKKILENGRVIVWDYEWRIGVPTPLHYHDKDAVVIYMKNGTLKRTTPDGQDMVDDIKAGTIRYIARGAKHTELLVNGVQHGLMVELK